MTRKETFKRQEKSASSEEKVYKPTKEIWTVLSPSLLPFLLPKDLGRLSIVCKDLRTLVESNDGVWQEFCKNEGFKVQCKVPSQKWKEAYKQMTEFKDEMNYEEGKYAERYEKWNRIQMGYACGMRGPPPKPNFKMHNPNTNTGGLYGGFKVHPLSSVQTVLPFSVDLPETAKAYLDLLIEASAHDVFDDSKFLGQAITKYVNFLHLKHKYPNIVLIPTLEVEYVWVSHMLRPSIYANDCKRLFGEMIDHNILLTTTYQCMNKANYLKETRNLYDKEFQEKYCSDELIDKQTKIPHFSYSGSAPVNPPVTPEKPDAGEPFRTPKVLKPVERTVSFAGGLGEPGKSSSAKQKLIGLSVDDIRMDGMWLTEFNDFMKSAIEKPLSTTQILSGCSPYQNPCKMSTREVYQIIWKAYEKFLYMAAKYPPDKGEYVHPTYAIDVMWHAHMIYPKIYAKEVKEWVGYLVDHEPWPMCEKQAAEKSVDNTNNLWQKEFGNAIGAEHITRVCEHEGDNWHWLFDDEYARD